MIMKHTTIALASLQQYYDTKFLMDIAFVLATIHSSARKTTTVLQCHCEKVPLSIVAAGGRRLEIKLVGELLNADG
jgi:hypothetical protein